ncbi:S66 peptidase family protein [Rahnella laticis]|uniref:S66 family peptidase n=1 Tax=Rahnella laticis TaxID=2787622 RepID=UPI0018A2DFF5|nr:S66 peptidase family protein [Rahnella laticis]MBF7994801.1 LD-carboxypeptidase [Rahnella laticis]
MPSSGTPLFPPALKTGDTIGFFSASSPVTATAPNRFVRGKDFLREKGFVLRAGFLTGESDHYRSGSVARRAEELNQLFRDPQVRCVMSTIGGNNTNSLLPYLDYDALRADPKIIIGYSDTTALLAGIYAQTGLITFYGPALVASFGEFPPLVDETYASFTDVLMNRHDAPYGYSLPSHWTDEKLNWNDIAPVRAKHLYANSCRFLGKGRIEGRVIGGNLNTLSGIWGSPYQPEIRQGDILFIEDSLKDIATVERSFSMLKLNGVFDRVSAIVLGKHELFDDAGTGRQPADVLLEILNGQDIPLVDGFDCCHTHPMLTLPLGVDIAVDFDRQQIHITGQYLS